MEIVSRERGLLRWGRCLRGTRWYRGRIRHLPMCRIDQPRLPICAWAHAIPGVIIVGRVGQRRKCSGRRAKFCGGWVI